MISHSNQDIVLTFAVLGPSCHWNHNIPKTDCNTADLGGFDYFSGFNSVF
jgi:hypothetical protein